MFTAEENLTLFAQIYGLVLFAGGITCLVHFLATSRPLRSAFQPERWRVREWRLGFTDFALGVLILTFAVVSAQFLVGNLLFHATDAEGKVLPLLLGNLTFHLSALLTVLVLHRAYPSYFIPFSTPILTWPRAVRFAAYAFFASLPIVLGISFLWQNLLEATNLPAEQQDVVTLFTEIDEWVVLLGWILLTVVVAPVNEEIIFRGCLYRFLKSKTPVFAAMAVNALLFAMLHMNWLSFLPLFLLGLVLAYAYERSGSVRVPILLHALFNANMIVLIFLTRDLP